MTQAFNLAQLANNLNTSGQLDATDGLNGLVANANLASSGSASSSTYLRGDRTWASLPAPGKILQVVSTIYTTQTSVSGSALTSWGVSATITPSATSSRIIVMFTSWIQPTGECYVQGYLYRNGSRVTDLSNPATTGSSIGSLSGGSFGLSTGADNANNQGRYVGFTAVDSPSSTSALTYDIRTQASGSYNSFYINKNTSVWSQSAITTLTLMEVGA